MLLCHIFNILLTFHQPNSTANFPQISSVIKQPRRAMILLPLLGDQYSQQLNIAKYAFSFLKWSPQSQMTIDLALNLRNCSGLWRLLPRLRALCACNVTVTNLPSFLEYEQIIEQFKRFMLHFPFDAVIIMKLCLHE